MLEDISPSELQKGDCVVTSSGRVFRMLGIAEENEKFCQWYIEPVRHMLGNRMTFDREYDMLKVIR